MKRTQVYLTDEIVSFIKTFGSTHQLSQSDIIRNALENYMNELKSSDKKKVFKKYAGIWKNNDVDFLKVRKGWDR